MRKIFFLINFGFAFMITSCNKPTSELIYKNPEYKILFLHHSTGNNVWYGDISPNKRFYFGKSMCMVPRLLKDFNDSNGVLLSIEERSFPKGNPYPWENYPFDYYNIWVKNASDKPFLEEPTIEMLAKTYNLIIFKHCFPASSISEDNQNPDINSSMKTAAIYKLQYNALKEKIYNFPNTDFLLWTMPALTEKVTTPEDAKRAQDFANWVINEWDKPGDNIHIFDFRQIETEGGLYIKPEYAIGDLDSHPNSFLSMKAAKLFVESIIDCYENHKD